MLLHDDDFRVDVTSLSTRDGSCDQKKNAAWDSTRTRGLDEVQSVPCLESPWYEETRAWHPASLAPVHAASRGVPSSLHMEYVLLDLEKHHHDTEKGVPVQTHLAHGAASSCCSETSDRREAVATSSWNSMMLVALRYYY